MIAQAKALVSADDYFILDQQSHSKLEYYAGTIVAQAGSTARHNLILTNVIGHLYPQVRLHGCHTVSYTHLDVYKRQLMSIKLSQNCLTQFIMSKAPVIIVDLNYGSLGTNS